MSKIGGIIKLKRFAYNPCVVLEVCPEKLVGYGGISGKEEEHTRILVPRLFNYALLNKKLEILAIENKPISLEEIRALCLDCARFPEAIITVDVAILHWIVEFVEGNTELIVDFGVMKSVCFLSVHPGISVHCESDIIRALEIFSRCLQTKKWVSFGFLVNLLKFIDSHNIREVVKTIITSLYTSTDNHKRHLECRLVLGPKDSFLATLEGKLTEKEQTELTNHVNDYYPNCFFKFYSKGECLRVPCLFYGVHDMSKHLFIRADVDNEDNLLWKNDCISWKNISFADSSLPSSSLFIIYGKSLPAGFWAKIKLCKNLEDFEELLTKPEMKFTILYNDVTIMKSNVQFTIASPSKQPDNQDANV